MISIFRVAEIRHRLGALDVVVTNDYELAGELIYVHEIPTDKVKVLLCCPDNEFLIMSATDYEDLAKQEGDLIEGL
jgi:hypothetical protein